VVAVLLILRHSVLLRSGAKRSPRRNAGRLLKSRRTREASEVVGVWGSVWLGSWKGWKACWKGSWKACWKDSAGGRKGSWKPIRRLVLVGADVAPVQHCGQSRYAVVPAI
jgi:hypothetical protein